MAEYGVIGRVLKHSWSPEIHKQLGTYSYEKFELEPTELEEFLKNSEWCGMNVTIPYKKDVLAWASSVADAAKRLGAANTLVRKVDGTYEADNTDLYGFAYMLSRFANKYLGGVGALKGAKALVLGSGGASRAVCGALEDVEANVVIISRSGANNYENLLELHSDAQLIVNTTPVGMYPACPASPLETRVLEQMSKLKGVLDVVYNPERTGLMLAAEQLGIPSHSGLIMLVAQAFRSSEIWQNCALDASLIDSIEARLIAQTRNVVLIGMPGSGKTSTGRELGSILGRKHVDLDKAFEQEYSKTPADVIKNEGEEAFRKLETAVIAKYCKQSGLIISCGGGVVTRPENFALMHQNGEIVLIDRNLNELSSKGRPLSQSKGIAKLAEERMPLYKAWADIEQHCCGSAHGDALQIAQALGL